MAKELSTIEGIGPKLEEKLKAAGVESVEKLVEQSKTKKGREDLASASGIDEGRILQFVNRARLMHTRGSKSAGKLGVGGDAIPAWAGEQYASWDLSTAVQRVTEGLPTESLEIVRDRLDLSNDEFAEAVLIKPRTLMRRKKEERLRPDESERVYRIARLAEIAARALGAEAEARAWMKEPNYALGGQRPLDVARTEPGARLVERVLRQIEHGIMV